MCVGRLQFLDGTLQRMIERFERQFPETRLGSESDPIKANHRQKDSLYTSIEEAFARSSTINDSTSPEESTLGQSPEPDATLDDEEFDPFAVRLSRRGSNTSLHSRALTSEEGEVHRFTQHLRRDILDSELENSIEDSPQIHDNNHLSVLREKLERLRGTDMQSRIETVGVDKALEELGSSAEELLLLQKQDPEAFARFKESQIAAQINAGLRKPGD